MDTFLYNTVVIKIQRNPVENELGEKTFPIFLLLGVLPY